MKRVVLSCLLLCSSLSFGQNASREQVLELFQTLRIQQTFDTMQQTMTSQMNAAMMQAMKEQIGREFTAKDEEFFHQLMNSVVNQTRSMLPQMLDLMVPIYQ
jgi:hypothetical protein